MSELTPQHVLTDLFEELLVQNPEELAKIVHTSAYHFSRQFKAATGMPPHQYVLARRIERAGLPNRRLPAASHAS